MRVLKVDEQRERYTRKNIPRERKKKSIIGQHIVKTISTWANVAKFALIFVCRSFLFVRQIIYLLFK